MLKLEPETRVYLYTGKTDMRCGSNRLQELVREYFSREAYDGHVYAFVSRDRKKVKLLYWERIDCEPKLIWFYLDVDKEERKKRKADRNRDEADSNGWFDWLEEKVGPYAGAPSVEGVTYHELNANDMTAQEVVQQLNQIILDCR